MSYTYVTKNRYCAVTGYFAMILIVMSVCFYADF